MDTHIVALISCPSKAEADELATKILEQRLAASINILDGVPCLSHENDAIKKTQESLLIVKTNRGHLDSLTNFVALHHAHEVPAIIALPIVGGSSDHMNWINSQTAGV